jgi:hypothetical protein
MPPVAVVKTMIIIKRTTKKSAGRTPCMNNASQVEIDWNAAVVVMVDLTMHGMPFVADEVVGREEEVVVEVPSPQRILLPKMQRRRKTIVR